MEYYIAMKYLAFFLLFNIIGQVVAQENMLATKSIYSLTYQYAPTNDFLASSKDFLSFTKDLKLISISTVDSEFQRTYMINKDGETVSSGFMSSSYFLPNDNFIVISGKNTKNKDSFNPYGAYDMTSAIIFGTFNNFISRIKIIKR